MRGGEQPDGPSGDDPRPLVHPVLPSRRRDAVLLVGAGALLVAIGLATGLADPASHVGEQLTVAIVVLAFLGLTAETPAGTGIDGTTRRVPRPAARVAPAPTATAKVVGILAFATLLGTVTGDVVLLGLLWLLAGGAEAWRARALAREERRRGAELVVFAEPWRERFRHPFRGRAHLLLVDDARAPRDGDERPGDPTGRRPGSAA